MKKYKLTDETIIAEDGTVLHRIECLTDFADIRVGDKGGFIESERNLSQTNIAWVYDNACVYNNACVFGNARILGNARVFDNARVCGNAYVCDNARVYGNVYVYDNAWVYGEALVYGNGFINGEARICGNAIVQDIDDYIVFKNNFSSGRYFTWTRSNDMWRVGCFYGTGEQLIEKAYQDSKLKGDCYKAYVELVEKLKEIQNKSSEFVSVERGT